MLKNSSILDRQEDAIRLNIKEGIMIIELSGEYGVIIENAYNVYSI